MKSPIFLAFCALSLAGCHKEKLVLNPPPPPAEYMACKPLPGVPEISGLTPFWSGEHLVYSKADVDARDVEIARWIVQVRGAWFDCSNQLARVRDYYEAAGD